MGTVGTDSCYGMILVKASKYFKGTWPHTQGVSLGNYAVLGIWHVYTSLLLSSVIS